MPGGLTVKEREELMKEKITPAKVQSRQRRPVGDTGIADIYTEDKGQPPMGQDMGSAKPAKKMANGGMVKKASGGVLDELERGVRRVGQDLNIAEDPNKYGKTKAGEKIANSDFAKAARNEVRLRKEGMGMRAKNDEFEKKKGGVIKSSASSRADGCAIRGKTKGRMV